ncbi:hypothetical protein V8C44DRAFT_148612 [Trichoderma aethiopicum]
MTMTSISISACSTQPGQGFDAQHDHTLHSVHVLCCLLPAQLQLQLTLFPHLPALERQTVLARHVDRRSQSPLQVAPPYRVLAHSSRQQQHDPSRAAPAPASHLVTVGDATPWAGTWEADSSRPAPNNEPTKTRQWLNSNRHHRWQGNEQAITVTTVITITLLAVTGTGTGTGTRRSRVARAESGHLGVMCMSISFLCYMHGEPIWTRTRAIVRFQTSLFVHRQSSSLADCPHYASYSSRLRLRLRFK